MFDYVEDKTAKNPLILIRGIPGSGKSTLATKLSYTYNLPMIDPDFLTQDHQDFKNYVKLNSKELHGLSVRTKKYRYNLNLATKYVIDSKGFIWAQAWSLLEGINYTMSTIAKISNKHELLCIVFDLKVDINIAVERFKIKTSSHREAQKVVEEFANKYEWITQPNFLHILIDGHKSKDAVFHEVASELNKLL
ncbi:hypothetical protein C4561_01020 [candidate division WWE3 bacterium]|jgi:adenylate kinase family enzyme|uniref:ATP-binding protein n=1 Tax=candidate division WWE3 bacterium TaxID=2053526 RepID=A0A3A4ZFN8_UNCKA|nr:MAG: hypothetical protein C4561_01020 [candidate division WWE3 bacterium]